MAQTVIGFFDNRNEAQKAVEKLVGAGISRDRVDISNGRSNQTNVSHTDRDRDRDSEGGITGFFKSLFGGNDDEADRYSRVAESSDCIVTVHALSSDEAERAADLLDEYGAIDVDERSSNYGAVSGTRDASSERDTTIPVIREDLEVGKRSEERGGVRVRSRIVERPVEEHIRLREEHVRVERNPVDRPVRGDEMGAFREGEIELHERAEVPVVNKEAHVVEEIRLSKEVTERDETIRDNVRSTEVDVDQLGRSGSADDRSNVSLREDDMRDDSGYQDLRNTDRSTDNDLRDNLRDNTNRSL